MNERYLRVDDAGLYQPYRLASDGLTQIDVGAPFRTPREGIDFCNGVVGTPRPVSFSLPTGETVLVDECDEGLLAGGWTRFPGKHTLYAARERRVGGRKTRLFLHRLISGAPDGVLVDHVNGDGLDNRRSNLRPATVQENNRNRRPGASGAKGIRQRPNGRWQAHIQVDRRLRHLGTFDSREAASQAYDAAALVLFGEFARPNAIQGSPAGVSSPDLARALGGTASRDEAGAPTEAPGSPGASETSGPAVEIPPSAAGVSCEVCRGPLPAGSRRHRRTCGVACRQRAQYRRAHGLPVGDDDATDRVPTLSDRSTAVGGGRLLDPTARPAADAHRLPAAGRDARPDSAPRAIGDLPTLGL